MTTVRQQWPLAVLLVVVAAADIESSRGLGVPGEWWVAPGAAVVAVLSLLAAARPVAVAVAATAVFVVWSAVLRVAGVVVLGNLVTVELLALVAITVAVVRHTRPRVAAGLTALVFAGAAAAELLRPDYWAPNWEVAGDLEDPWWLLLPALAMLALPVAYGRYLRARDRERDQARRAAVLGAQQRERLHLARELHDVVAHHVGGMVVQAQAAQAVAGSDPDAAARVMPAIERSGGDALSAMRRLVAALRDGDALPPLGRTADLAADLRAITAAGSPPVRLTVALDEPVADEVATSVLRLMQESVTNARRHAAGAREIAASVRTENGAVRIEVRDDGQGTAVERGGGFGLIGMRERTHLLGGRFEAGRAAGGGWQVTAEVPLQ